MQSSREPVLRYHAKVQSRFLSYSQECSLQSFSLEPGISQVSLCSDVGSTARSAQEYSERSAILTRPLKVDVLNMQECLV